MNSIPEHQSPNKVHMWILILLGWTAVFSLIAVGLLLTKSTPAEMSSADISLACQNGTLNGITTNLSRISDACQETSVEPETVGTRFDAAHANGNLPALTLPIGWTAAWSLGLFQDDTIATFDAVKGVYETCNECGGLENPPNFSVITLPLARAGFMDVAAIQADYVEKSKAEDADYSDIVVSSTTTAGGTLVSIDGVEDIQAAGSRNGPFHILRFANATKYIEIVFYEYGATNDEWLTVKNSLDWSNIK